VTTSAATSQGSARIPPTASATPDIRLPRPNAAPRTIATRANGRSLAVSVLTSATMTNTAQ
jgi:hypothetical protein